MGLLEKAIRKGIRKGIGDAVAITLLPIAAGAILFITLKKRSENTKAEGSPPPEAHNDEKEHIVVMTRYSDAEIERFTEILSEIANLTVRELDVLREIMRGHKQSEVAHYLGIEVSTVKDFYKKIYTKLDVSNKDGLFLKISELLQSY